MGDRDGSTIKNKHLKNILLIEQYVCMTWKKHNTSLHDAFSSSIVLYVVPVCFTSMNLIGSGSLPPPPLWPWLTHDHWPVWILVHVIHCSKPPGVTTWTATHPRPSKTSKKVCFSLRAVILTWRGLLCYMEFRCPNSAIKSLHRDDFSQPVVSFDI